MNAPDDRAVLIALCTRELDGDYKPFTDREAWELVVAARREGRPIYALLREREDAADAHGEGRLKLLDDVGRLEERHAENGIWMLTAADELYPMRLLERLGHRAPPLLYGAGDQALLAQDGIGVVGSRNIDDETVSVTRSIGEFVASISVSLVSGGARGVDQIAMNAAVERGGSAVGVLTHPLEKEIRGEATRGLLAEERICLLTPFRPSMGFTVANAMSRNKIVYALSRVTVVVASDDGSGGTWTGAVESLRHQFGPVMVWSGPGAGPGNAALVKRGGRGFGDVEALRGLERAELLEAEDSDEQLSLGM